MRDGRAAARRVPSWLRLLAARCTCVGALVLTAAAAPAQIEIDAGLRVSAPMRSMKNLRDRQVVRQRYDYSCGAAALATMLRYGFGEDVTERDLLEALFASLSETEAERVEREGFSLLHLQRVAQKLGYDAQGFRLAPEQLALIGGPVIVYLEPRGYKHFAVLRGTRGDRVYLADPSRGNLRMADYEFLESWLGDDGMGIIFAVQPGGAPSNGATPLIPSGDDAPRPELMTAREMLAVGSSLSSRLPDVYRSGAAGTE